MGSKRRIAPELLKAIPRTDETWVEPFVGGCGFIQHVTGKRIGSDSNPYIIAYWKAIQSGWVPPEFVSEAEYQEIKNNREKFDPALVAFVGFGCSFGGKFFRGYARSNQENNYARQARNLSLKMREGILGVELSVKPYQDVEIPENSIVYCDPPYLGTEKYKASFDSPTFWNWAREISITGTPVYVSEYLAPTDFLCIKAVVRTGMMQHGGGQLLFDRLYTHKSNYERLGL